MAGAPGGARVAGVQMTLVQDVHALGRECLAQRGLDAGRARARVVGVPIHPTVNHWAAWALARRSPG